MLKIVEGGEFSAQKKTIMATRLAGEDRLCRVVLLPGSSKKSKKMNLILQSEGGYFLRFDLDEVTVKKKSALGIKGMNLSGGDHVKEVYLTGLSEGEPEYIVYKDKELYFAKIRLMSRNTKGVKVRR